MHCWSLKTLVNIYWLHLNVVFALSPFDQRKWITELAVPYEDAFNSNVAYLIFTFAKEDMFSLLFACLLATLRKNFQTDFKTYISDFSYFEN